MRLASPWLVLSAALLASACAAPAAPTGATATAAGAAPALSPSARPSLAETVPATRQAPTPTTAVSATPLAPSAPPPRSTPEVPTAAACPAIPKGQAQLPPDVAAAVERGEIFGAGSQGEGLLGAGPLWVGGMPDRGVAVILPQNGEMGWKLGWWLRQPGEFRLAARRLDGAAPPPRVSPERATASGFLASRVVFPSEGCWEVVGSLDGQDLRLVLRVVRGAATPREALERFMAARITRDDQLALGLLADDVRARALGGGLSVPLLQVSNPCWYRSEVLALEQPEADAAVARVRVYEHFWAGDVAGGPPRSWEQEVRLAREAFPGWIVAGLGEAEEQRPEPAEPHGPNRSACLGQ